MGVEIALAFFIGLLGGVVLSDADKDMLNEDELCEFEEFKELDECSEID